MQRAKKIFILFILFINASFIYSRHVWTGVPHTACGARHRLHSDAPPQRAAWDNEKIRTREATDKTTDSGAPPRRAAHRTRRQAACVCLREGRCAPAPRAVPGPRGRALLTATSDGSPSRGRSRPFPRRQEKSFSSSKEKSFSSSLSTPLPWEKAFSSSLHRRRRLWARGIIRDTQMRLFSEGVGISLAVAAAVGPRVPFPRVP